MHNWIHDALYASFTTKGDRWSGLMECYLSLAVQVAGVWTVWFFKMSLWRHAVYRVFSMLIGRYFGYNDNGRSRITSSLTLIAYLHLAPFPIAKYRDQLLSPTYHARGISWTIIRRLLTRSTKETNWRFAYEALKSVQKLSFSTDCIFAPLTCACQSIRMHFDRVPFLQP